MKKALQLIPFILILGFLLSACKKNSVDEQYTETVHPVVPDLSTQINASVDGFITDETGTAVEGALVKAGAVTANTDEYGYFKLTNASFAKSAAFIQVTKTGYFTGFRTFLPRTGKQTFIRLQLIPKINSGTIDGSTGGTVTASGASVTLPANAVVIASNNTAYTGAVNLAVHWLDPSDMTTTQLIMPGDLRGIDSDGYLNTLTTFGMMAVELTSDAGELLQIAPGQKASLTFPIPASLQGSAPASIPLWYFNENNGLWVEDGQALKNGNNYNGDVSHFSWWNCDVPGGTVNFSMQLLDMSLAPLTNVAITITANGDPNNCRTNYTDANGEIFGAIPANSNIAITVASSCNAGVALYSQNIVTTNQAVDLGSVKINPVQEEGVLKGYVKNCSGSPVTDGYVIISTGVSNKVVEINNGDFSAASIICPNANAVVIAFDRATSQQSSLQNFTLVPGLNDLDTLEACAPATVESITYLLDGVPKTLVLPQHMFNGNFDFSSSNTDINAIDLLNGSVTVFSLGFPGPDAPGNYPLTGTIVLDQVPYAIVGIGQISVTSYGLIGEWIIATITDLPISDGIGSQTLNSCTINIKRDM